MSAEANEKHDRNCPDRNVLPGPHLGRIVHRRQNAAPNGGAKPRRQPSQKYLKTAVKLWTPAKSATCGHSFTVSQFNYWARVHRPAHLIVAALTAPPASGANHAARRSGAALPLPSAGAGRLRAPRTVRHASKRTPERKRGTDGGRSVKPPTSRPAPAEGEERHAQSPQLSFMR